MDAAEGRPVVSTAQARLVLCLLRLLLLFGGRMGAQLAKAAGRAEIVEKPGEAAVSPAKTNGQQVSHRQSSGLCQTRVKGAIVNTRRWSNR